MPESHVSKKRWRQRKLRARRRTERGKAAMEEDILLLDDEDCESGQQGQESQLATSTQEKSRKSTFVRRKRKNDTRDSREESSPRPDKVARRQDDSVPSSDPTVTKHLSTQKASENVRQSDSRSPSTNASSKKGKEKVRDKQTKTPSTSHRKRTKEAPKKRRNGSHSHDPRATSRTTACSKAGNDQNAPQASEPSIPCSRGATRDISQSTRPPSSHEEISDDELCPDVKAAFKKEPDGRKMCIHCGKHFAIKSGPTTLKYHVKKSCRVLVHRTQRPVFIADHANMMVCTMIAEDCLPLSFTENTNLRMLCDYLKPGYKPPCRTTLRQTILPKIKVALRKAMKAKLATIDFVSISFDGWTSDALQNYIAVLCHGITSDWTLETFLLDVIPVNESETAEHIAEIVRRVLSDWGISLEAVVAAATDGAPNMQCSVAKELGMPWIYCAAHAINRSVFNALDIDPIKTVVVKANALCGMFSWPGARRGLLRYQKQLELSTKVLRSSCPTRWGSVKKMFKRLDDSREAIALYLAKRHNRRNPELSDDQWQIIGDMLGALRRLNEATLELSQQKIPTIGLITPIFSNLLNGLEAERRSENEDDMDEDGQLHPAVVEFKQNVVEDLLDRWGMLKAGASMELVMSAYLDPRTKDFAFVEDRDERRKCLGEAIEKATELLESMTHKSRGIGSDEKDEEEESNSNDEAPAAQKLRAKRERMIRLYGRQAEVALGRHGGEQGHHEEIKRYTELDAYPLFCGKDAVMSDPLAWWKEHRLEYPRLAQLARRYLCITPTSVPCERVFSKGGWIVNKRRCSLSPDRVSTLVFVSYNKHHKNQ